MGRSTRARGIFINAEGCKTVDKLYKGQRIYARLGRTTQRRGSGDSSTPSVRPSYSATVLSELSAKQRSVT